MGAGWVGAMLEPWYGTIVAGGYRIVGAERLGAVVAGRYEVAGGYVAILEGRSGSMADRGLAATAG